MNETIFEQVESFASVLKLDFSAEEFAQFAEDQELSEAGMEAVRAVFSYQPFLPAAWISGHRHPLHRRAEAVHDLILKSLCK